MRQITTLTLALAGAVVATGCRDAVSPTAARILAVVPGAVLPRSTAAEPARIPIDIRVDCGDHGALAFDIQAANGHVLVTARGRSADFDGGCVHDLDTVLRDTLTLAPLLLRDSTVVRFRQPSGLDSIRVVRRPIQTAAP